jgi:CPA1 family monovalent cation:H+ antiporter
MLAIENPEYFLALFIIIILVALIAQKINVSYPTAFLLAGIALGFLPNTPTIDLKPEYILIIFLPPLLVESAYYTSMRDFWRNKRAILQLAIGLVIATSAAVAYVFTLLVPNVGWAAAFCLGAIVSPPDAVAATSILNKMRIPKRIVAILEGESLINDATGLVIYKFAVQATVTGIFVWQYAGLHFIWMVISGIVIGYLFAKAFLWVFPYIHETSVEILSTFIVPYIVYIAADYAFSSSVLAVVTCGVVVGWNAPEVYSTNFRIQAANVWDIAIFILNSFVFLLIGLEMPAILSRLSHYTFYDLLYYSSIIIATVMVVRMIWVFVTAYGIRYLFPSILKVDPYPKWQNVFFIGWVGMRGVVSLATALALPLFIADGSPFPYRDLIIFLAVAVTFFTLVVQGLTLPWILRKLTLDYDPKIIYEDWHARKKATEDALHRIEKLAEDPTTYAPALERIRSHYVDKLQSLADGPSTPITPTEVPSSQNHPLIIAEDKIWQDLLEVERKSIISLRKSFIISDDVMKEIMHDLDLMSSRFSNH